MGLDFIKIDIRKLCIKLHDYIIPDKLLFTSTKHLNITNTAVLVSLTKNVMPGTLIFGYKTNKSSSTFSKLCTC